MEDIYSYSKISHTIGQLIETLAAKVSSRRSAARVIPSASRGREHVWIVYCCPEYRHFDHTYLVVNGLCQDERLRASPVKLVPSDNQTSNSKSWRSSPTWARLVATVNFLDVRLVNLPIITAVTSALAYGDEKLINSFKETTLAKFQKQIEAEFPEKKLDSIVWSQRLVERRQQTVNARDSLERTNLWRLFRGMAAGPQKGGKPESPNVLAQYLHLRDVATEQNIHYYLGCAMRDLLKHHQISGLVGDGVETETSLVPGQTDPVPDIAIHTNSDTHALELHFSRKQLASSEIGRYALENVIKKYMKSLPHLRSALEAIE